MKNDSETELQGKFIVLTPSVRIEERLEINAQSTKLRKLEKKQQNKQNVWKETVI